MKNNINPWMTYLELYISILFHNKTQYFKSINNLKSHTQKSNNMKSNVFHFLKMLVLCGGILFFSKNANAQCSGFNVTLTQISDGPQGGDAVLQATVTGGSSNIRYYWTDASYSYGSYTWANTFQDSAGTRCVIVLDSGSGNNCRDTACITVTDTSIASCANQVSIIPAADGANLNDVTLSVSSNFATNSRYQWYNGTYNPILIGTGASVSSLGAGYYSLIVTDTVANCYSQAYYNAVDTSINNLVTSKYLGTNIDSTSVSNLCSTQSLMMNLYFSKNAGTTTVRVDYGDGTVVDSVHRNVGYTYSTYSHQYSTTGAKTLKVYFINVNGVKEDSFTRSFNVVPCITLSGVVYSDANKDCVKQSSESVVSSALVNIYDNSNNFITSVYAGTNGVYTYNGAIGNTTYKLSVSTSFLNCSTAGMVSVTTGSTNATKDLGIRDTMIISNKYFYRGIDSNKNYNCLMDSLRTYVSGGKSLGNLDVKIFWGDGTSSTISPNNQGTYFYANQSHKYSAAGSYTILIQYLYNGLVVDTSMSSVLVANCGNLSGKVYLDSNKNCNYNAGEARIPYQPIVIKDAATGVVEATVYTDYQGNYSINLDNSKNYQLHLIHVIGCRNGVNYVNVSSWTTGASITKDIPLDPDSLNFSVYTWQNGSTRPNMNYHIYFGYNGLFSTANQQYKITLPAKVSFVSSSLSSYSISGNVVTVNASTSPNYYSWYSHYITVRIDTTVTHTDTLCFWVELVRMSNEADTSDNVINFCRPAFVSYDPNDKSASSASMNKDGSFSNPNDEITYTVRFQNTGTAPARNVNVRDVIDPNLDLNTFRIRAMSHKGSIYTNENREMKFDFPEIELPDSLHDEPRSHGHIIYSIRPKAGLALNTTISNTAAIYFDYNAPVMTNTTRNTYKIVEVVNSIISSPSIDFTLVRQGNMFGFSAPERIQQILITDIGGKTIQKVSPNSKKTEIDMGNLSESMYIIRVDFQKGYISKKFIFQ